MQFLRLSPTTVSGPCVLQTLVSYQALLPIMLSGTNSIISGAHILDPKSLVMLGKLPGSGGVKLRGEGGANAPSIVSWFLYIPPLAVDII